jgi:phenylacetate-CoA ligase
VRSAWADAPREEVEAAVTARLLAVVRRAAARVPFYRWFYADIAADLPRLRTREDLTSVVPCMTKADVVRFQEHVGDVPWTLGHRQLHLTSGTSGKGREWYLRDSADLVALGLAGAEGLARAGIGAGDRVLLTIPQSQTMAGPYFQESCRAVGAVPVAAYAVDTPERVEQAVRFGVTAIVGTPSHLHRLATEARALGLDPRVDMPRLTTLVLSGEPFGSQWARAAEQFWGATVHEGWGATQTLGVALTTCELGVLPETAPGLRGTLHGIEQRCHVEPLRPDGGTAEPGERGELVVTTLRSSGMPTIRFRMGDEARVREPGTCPCGRAGPAYESGTISRVDDMLKIRGMNVWPMAVDEVVLARRVVDYRGVVFTDDAGREQVLLRVATAETDPGWIGELEAELRHHVGVSMRIEPVEEHAFADNTFKSRRWEDRRDVQGA